MINNVELNLRSLWKGNPAAKLISTSPVKNNLLFKRNNPGIIKDMPTVYIKSPLAVKQYSTHSHSTC